MIQRETTTYVNTEIVVEVYIYIYKAYAGCLTWLGKLIVSIKLINWVILAAASVLRNYVVIKKAQTWGVTFLDQRAAVQLLPLLNESADCMQELGP